MIDPRQFNGYQDYNNYGWYQPQVYHPPQQLYYDNYGQPLYLGNMVPQPGLYAPRQRNYHTNDRYNKYNRNGNGNRSRKRYPRGYNNPRRYNNRKHTPLHRNPRKPVYPTKNKGQKPINKNPYNKQNGKPTKKDNFKTNDNNKTNQKKKSKKETLELKKNKARFIGNGTQQL